MPSVNIQFLAPNQSGLLTLVDDGLEEATEHLHAIARANARQAGMIGKWLIQIVAHIPTHAQPILCMRHQQTFGANALEKHHQLEFEKDDGINGRTTTACIRLLNKLADKRQVECALQVTVEVIGWD
jgi:hypothetical protein